MELLVERLVRRGLELGRWFEIEQSEPAEVRIIREDTADARRVDFDDSHAPVLSPGGGWQEPLNSTVWLRFKLCRPADWPVPDTALVAQRFGNYPFEPGGRIGRDLQRMQGLLYLDGKAYHGLDQFHKLIYLPEGPDYHFAASIWTGFAEMDWQPNPVFRLVRLDPGAVQLAHDLRILTDALQTLAVDDSARPALERLAEASQQYTPRRTSRRSSPPATRTSTAPGYGRSRRLARRRGGPGAPPCA
jgi:hypothetical protein